MTSSSAHPPGTVPRELSNGTAASHAAPSDAVSLNDLIADSGPLPADAALECVQRLAVLLDGLPHVRCDSLSPNDVLIDDDGEVWLNRSPSAESDPATEPHPARLDRLGRLLAFLTTGDNDHLSSPFTLETTSSPSPIATVAAAHFARQGVCYCSYAELARDAAGIKDSSPTEEPIPDMTTPPADVLAEHSTPALKATEALPAPRDTPAEATPAAELPAAQASESADDRPTDLTSSPTYPNAEEHRRPSEPPPAAPLSEELVAVQRSAETSESLDVDPPISVTPGEAPSENSWLGVGIAVAVAAGAALAFVVYQFL